MYRAKIRSVAFTEYPVKDLGSAKATQLDVLIDLNRITASQLKENAELYCLAVLEKICELSNQQINAFIQYQQSLLNDAVDWLTRLNDLIILNEAFFSNRNLILKADRTVMLIELAIRANNSSHNKSKIYALDQVKQKLKHIPDVEDQLEYLCNIKTEYLQHPAPHTNPGDVPFDKQIQLEIDKIYEVQEALNCLKNRKHKPFQSLENYVDNDEFIRLMKISKRTAQNWRNTGIIAFCQIYHKIYYKLSDVENLFQSNYLKNLKSRLA